MQTLLVHPAPRTRPVPVGLLTPSGGQPAAQPMLPLPPTDTRTPLVPSLPPDRERAARALCLALVEALAGRRPAVQLRAAMPSGAVRLVAGLALDGLAAGLRVASLRLQSPCEDAVEAAIRLADGARSRAAATRLQWRHDRWHCTALEVALADGDVSRWMRAAG